MKTEMCCVNIHEECACAESCGCTCYSCECWHGAVADVVTSKFTAHCPACDQRRRMILRLYQPNEDPVIPAGLRVACAYCGSSWPDLWCVSWPPRDGRKPANIPARSREHAERMAPKLNGRAQPWTESPEMHGIMVGALGRALASFGPAAAVCCDLHGPKCEPPSELCCEECTERSHPRHSDGSACSNPDLSGARATIAAMLEHHPPGVRHNHPPGTDHPDGVWGCHACALKALDAERESSSKGEGRGH